MPTTAGVGRDKSQEQGPVSVAPMWVSGTYLLHPPSVAPLGPHSQGGGIGAQAWNSGMLTQGGRVQPLGKMSAKKSF